MSFNFTQHRKKVFFAIATLIAIGIFPIGNTFGGESEKNGIPRHPHVDSEGLSKTSSVKNDQATVTGTITDENGEALPGVYVLIKGTSNGTVTDIDGNYSIEAPDTQVTLVFKIVGYVTEEIKIGNQTTIDLKMKEDLKSLEEVVVVGYGSEKKINLTGSVSSISNQDIESRPITNISAGLSGLAAGVQVSQSNGGIAGGDGGTIRIRGVGTFNNANPLIVVDGIPSEGTGIMNDIDPNDIQDISILKDAASASIYGSRGANGVILITTKRGQEGKVSVSYNGYAGWQKSTRNPDFVSDMATYMEYANINRGTEIFNPSDIQAWRENANDPLLYPNVDWYGEQVGNIAKIQSHSFSVTGGTKSTQYRLSMNYLDQDGLVQDNNIKRYGVRTNLQSEIAKGFKVGGDIFFRWSDIIPNSLGSNTIDLGTVPGIPSMQHPDGRWGGAQHPAVGTVTNPHGQVYNKNDNINQKRILGSVFASYEIVNGLTATAKLSMNYNNQMRNTFNKRWDLWDFQRDIITREFGLSSGRSSTSRQDQDYQLTTNFLLEYQRSINDHNFKLLGGYEQLNYRDDYVSVTKNQYQNNEVTAIDAGLLVAGASGNTVEWALRSYFGRMNYNFQEKYFAEVNFRADGSSRFKEGNRWGYFPAFSVGWNIAKEDFMQSIGAVDNLKLRASWGKLGNNRIGNYPYQPTYSLNQNYAFGGEVYTGIAQTSLVNEDIKWEETTTTDIGLDAAFFEGKLSFTFDYFKRETDGILTGLPVPQFLGNKSNPTVNLASMVNKGVELSLGYRTRIGEVDFDVSGNVTRLQNEVTDYFADIQTGGTQIGYPYQSYYGLEAIGIFQSEDEVENAPRHQNNTSPGDIRFKDQLTEDTNNDGIPDAGNGVIDSNDRTIIGNRIPGFTYGGKIGLGYKGFDFGLVVQGVADRDINTFGIGVRPIEWSDRGVLHQRWIDDAWSQENPDGELPRLNQDAMQGLNGNTSSFWVKDVSFFRVKNLQLGYSLPQAVINSLKIQKLRVYFSIENLMTFTNEEWGFDPETVSADQVPNVRTTTIGLNIRL
ncbi:SusC/RagA family protein [Echinicola strongylocentroti]|uniref:SusC/RagA family protein n=1 Tax=Echinicola strongylocentroti TaxID=1795355 RepID=A0A2Z4IF03_9BACT|nr:TonB-dependent receptor [Echinicola strongylocentroti]AWW29514.1 SusC/RagA family protein [Echinicola strongylocentroti]